MKILYLLFAALFLMMQAGVEGRCTPRSILRCRLKGGWCYPRQCPYFRRRIGQCCTRHTCCN
uniref:As-beta-defensin-4 n=1 Tax=Apalone spinifera TaxID=55534 RepID=A0A0A1HAZ8_APASP|nr:As-beta-defensin-4 [Apalone spinifera]